MTKEPKKEKTTDLATINQALGTVLLNLVGKTSEIYGERIATVTQSHMNASEIRNVKMIAEQSKNFLNHDPVEITPLQLGGFVEWLYEAKKVDPSNSPLLANAWSQSLDGIFSDNYEMLRGLKYLDEEAMNELAFDAPISLQTATKLEKAGLGDIHADRHHSYRVNIAVISVLSLSTLALLSLIWLQSALGIADAGKFALGAMVLSIPTGLGIGIAADHIFKSQLKKPFNRANFVHKIVYYKNRRVWKTLRGRYVLGTLFPNVHKMVYLEIDHKTDP